MHPIPSKFQHTISFLFKKANTDIAGLSALHGHGNADQGGGGEDGDGPKLLDLNLSSIQGGETLHQKVTSASPIDFAHAKTKVIKPGGNGGVLVGAG